MTRKKNLLVFYNLGLKIYLSLYCVFTIRQGCIFCTRFIFPLLVFSTEDNGKKFKEFFILFILSPLLYIYLFLFTKEGRKWKKNVFSSLNFHIFFHN